MNYFSTEETAKRWGISSRRITILAKEGRIPGSLQVGTRWMIPSDAQKPADKRTKQNKDKNEASQFRFPIYISCKDNEISKLTKEEQMLLKAQLAFNACEFDKAEPLLTKLSEEANSRYIRISALVHLSLLLIAKKQSDRFIENQRKLLLMISAEDQYSNEMLLLKYMYDAIMGAPKALFCSFFIDTNYKYHPSSYGLLLPLSLFTTISGDLTQISKLRFDPFEAICQILEHEENYFEAQFLHIQLCFAYQMQANTKEAINHMRNVLKIAAEKKLYYLAAVNATYLPQIIDELKPEFPKDFINTIESYAKMTHEGYVHLTKALNTPTFFSTLSKKEYRFVYLATQGYSNKQIAEIMESTPFYVSKKFSEIYHKLNIKSKLELVKLFSSYSI